MAAHEQERSRLKLEKRMQELQKEAFHLANYYFVFQGVIFTAFYNGSSSFKCHYRWIPFTLSFLAGLINLSALTVIAYKYKACLDKKDFELYQRLMNQGSATPATVSTIVVSTISARSPNVTPYQEFMTPSSRSPTTTPIQSSNPRTPIVIMCAKAWRHFYIVVCMLLFGGFFFVTLFGCLKIPCRGMESFSVDDNKNCIKFCDSNNCITICQN